MTLSDIYKEVRALCPDLDVELDEVFGAAVSRAMADVAAELRLEKKHRILINSQKPLTRVEKFEHCGGSTETLPLVGRAYSVWVIGRGSFTVRSEGVTRVVEFDTEGRLYRGFISGEGSMTLAGEYSFVIYSLCCYGSVYSDAQENIPDGSGVCRYRLERICPEFGSMIDRPTDDRGKEIAGVCVSGGELIVPEGYSGGVILRYRVAPVCPSVTDAGVELPLPESAKRNVALLTVAWLMISEDVERAELYMSCYKDSMDREIRSIRQNLDTGYLVPNRWA